MTQCRGCKEGRRPPAQAQGRRDVRGKGVGSAQQQVAAGYQAQYHHARIKHQIEDIFLDLIVHDFLVESRAKITKIHQSFKFYPIFLYSPIHQIDDDYGPLRYSLTFANYSLTFANYSLTFAK
ncbi:MAG: hypothetical protein IJJ56_01290 [Prevotella sp.]|nr:hypothetical protein [Prevotella sp.]